MQIDIRKEKLGQKQKEEKYWTQVEDEIYAKQKSENDRRAQIQHQKSLEAARFQREQLEFSRKKKEEQEVV